MNAIPHFPLIIVGMYSQQEKMQSRETIGSLLFSPKDILLAAIPHTKLNSIEKGQIKII